MKKNQNDRGFTLIELMIAMAIFAIVITGIYQAYTKQQMSYLVQEQTSGMQQNFRAAMLMVSKDLRQAHCFLGQNTSFVSALGADSLEDGLKAFDNYDFNDPDNGATWDNGTDSGQGPDRVDVAFANVRTSANVQKQISETAANIEVMHEDKDKFNEDDIVVISNGQHTQLFYITGIQGTDESATIRYVHNQGGDDTGVINKPGNQNWPPGGYDAGSMIFKLKFVSYAVDTLTDPDHPRMMVDLDGPLPLGIRYVWQPVAHNIEDFQCRYIFADGDEADYPDETDADDTNDYEDTRAVRYRILARADRIIPGYTPRVVQDRDGNDLPQNYIRRWYETEVKLRNMGLNTIPVL